jgi:hypothetical protein
MTVAWLLIAIAVVGVLATVTWRSVLTNRHAGPPADTTPAPVVRPETILVVPSTREDEASARMKAYAAHPAVAAIHRQEQVARLQADFAQAREPAPERPVRQHGRSAT